NERGKHGSRNRAGGRRSVHRQVERDGRSWARVGSLLPLALLCGCATFIDDVSSNDFSLKNWFNKPNPLVVIRDSTDGNLRATALRSLREPIQNGGDQKTQDLYVTVLVKSAAEDRNPLCRLAAIRSLGRFKDPRAAEGLQNAYFKATAFTPETNTII